LGNLRVIAERAEEVAGRFDWIISRAVSYEDLSAAVKALAPNVALLTGDDEPPKRWGWRWESAIVVPGSKSRFLRLGMQG
jgi:hypothetical protein